MLFFIKTIYYNKSIRIYNYVIDIVIIKLIGIRGIKDEIKDS